VPPQPPILQVAVSSASSQPVIQAAAQLGSTQTAWPFIPTGSSIIGGQARTFVESLYDQVPAPGQKDEFAQYLALSSASHVLDGWRYMSQAALSFLNGSRTQAIHLAYYAELRAALAILAFSGIGILKRKHFALTSGMDVIWFQGATHDTTWKAIGYWSRQPVHGIEVLRCFSCLGLSGEEWAEACGAASSGTVQDIAEYWVSDWTVDLSTLGQDSDLRNEASYRPNLRLTALDLPSEVDLRFVRDACAASIPVDYGQFDIVDRAIVYDLCKKSYELLHIPSGATFLTFRAGLANWIVNQKNRSENEAIEMITSLRTAFRQEGGTLLRRARKEHVDVGAVFSRAFLLLRLASALLRLQWKETRLLKSPQDWQEQLLLSYVSHSLVHDKESPNTSYSTFGADQEKAIEEIDDWMNKNSAFNPYTLWDERPQSLVNLCKFERVGAVAVAL
jgi:hypothetical protein